MLQMAAYYRNARVAVNKTLDNNCAPVATPDTSAAKRVVMDTPSMHDVSAAAAVVVVAKPHADVTADAAGSHGDGSDEPSEARSLLTGAADRELCQHQRQTI